MHLEAPGGGEERRGEEGRGGERRGEERRGEERRGEERRGVPGRVGRGWAGLDWVGSSWMDEKALSLEARGVVVEASMVMSVDAVHMAEHLRSGVACSVRPPGDLRVKLVKTGSINVEDFGAPGEISVGEFLADAVA
ncbi:hypothetical protein [Streptomyces sp. NPDC093089]|uniref:hypothetical protein n=1 Tax=Streptomyces sp. NPDC093089 TaxID=3366024 RepID=UPI003825C1C7